MSEINHSTPIDVKYLMAGQSELLDIMCHLGLYKILIQLYQAFSFTNLLKLKLIHNDYSSLHILTATIAATEQFSFLTDIIKISECKPEQFYGMRFHEMYEIALILIEHRKTNAFNWKELFEKILFYLLTMYYQGSQWIKMMCESVNAMPTPQLDMHEFGRMIFLLECSLNDAKALLGCFMMIFCGNIYKIFQTYTKSHLTMLFDANGYIYYLESDSNTLTHIISQFRSYKSQKSIYNSGKDFVFEALNWKKSLIKNYISHKYYDSVEIYADQHIVSLIVGKAYLLNQQYDHAAFVLIQNVTCCHSAYKRVLALKSLTVSCYKNGKYLLALKTWKCAFKICGNDICKTFVQNQYAYFKRKIRRKWKNLRCAMCGKGNIKLKCCIGCMDTVYCNVRCQKIHWKNVHRYQCSGIWKNKYHMLGLLVFCAVGL
eukprot:483413_1